MLKIPSFLFGIIAISSSSILFSANSSFISVYAQDTQYYNNTNENNNSSSLLHELKNIKQYLRVK